MGVLFPLAQPGRAGWAAPPSPWNRVEKLSRLPGSVPWKQLCVGRGAPGLWGSWEGQAHSAAFAGSLLSVRHACMPLPGPPNLLALGHTQVNCYLQMSLEQPSRPAPVASFPCRTNILADGLCARWRESAAGSCPRSGPGLPGGFTRSRGPGKSSWEHAGQLEVGPSPKVVSEADSTDEKPSGRGPGQALWSREGWSHS